VPTTWNNALQAVYSGLVSRNPWLHSFSRNTNEEAYLFARLLKKLGTDSRWKFFTRSVS